jgi:hypothetical protein
MNEMVRNIASIVSLIGIAGLLILLLCIVIPKQESPDPITPLPKDDVRVVLDDRGWKVVEIEGCEYFYLDARRDSPRVPVLCHKGNCKNLRHQTYSFIGGGGVPGDR